MEVPASTTDPGLPFPAGTSPPLPAPTEASRCWACGYALVGLEADGLCPECGTPIADSIRGGFLAYAPLPHLRRLATWSPVTGLTIGVVDIVPAFFGFSGVWRMGVSFAASVLLAWVVWNLTVQEPEIQPKFDAPTTRRRLRISAAGIPVMLAVAMIFEWMGLGVVVGGWVLAALGIFWLVVVWILRILLHVDLAMYARWLAGRVPAVSLRTFANVCAGIGGVVVGVDLLGTCCFLTPIAGLLHAILFFILASEVREVIWLRTAAAARPPMVPGA